MKKLLPLLVTLALLCQTDAFGYALYCWDTNGTAPGAGGPTPTGTWGADAFWGKESWDGTVATEPWPAGNYAVFAAGNDAVGDYTVFVSGVVDVGDIHVDLGSVTFDPAAGIGGSLKLGSLLSVGHKSTETVARYNVPITDATSVFRYKRGTLIFGATNTFPGALTIEGGVVRCAVPYALGATNALILANNDPGRSDFNEEWRYTPAVFATGGFSQNLGPLRLAGTDWSVERVIDFGDGACVLTFADSSGEDWGGFPLLIVNYTPGVDVLRFGNNGAGLTQAQLNQMRFIGFGDLPGVIDAGGAVIYAGPVLAPPVRTGPSTVLLTWSSLSGKRYQVRYKNDLNDPNWQDLTPVVEATGPTATFTDTTASGTQRFYQVVMLIESGVS